MSKKKTDDEKPAEPRVTEEALHDRVKVRVESPDDPEAGYGYEVTGEKCCEYLTQMFAARGQLTSDLHNTIGSIQSQIGAPFHGK